jgi:hypothetical protein
MLRKREVYMWSFDMNNCISCSRIDKCPDTKVIQKTLRGLLDAVENNEGGSQKGVIVVVCKDPER